jgi:hypothetical protein
MKMIPWLREFIREATVQFPILIRPFTRWYFDLLKNALVIAALSYFAEKTGSKTLNHIARFSLLIFSLYCIRYLFSWEPWLINLIHSPIWRLLVILLFIPVISGLIYYLFTTTLDLMMQELLRAQSH